MSDFMNRFVEIDSYSDGMCGWVKWEDRGRGGHQVHVHWSVTNHEGITSQGRAREHVRKMFYMDTQFALDALVRDAHGRVGRVWSVYRDFDATPVKQYGQGREWLEAQSKPYTDAQKGELWYTVRSLDGGSVLTCHSRLTPVVRKSEAN